MSVAAPTPVSMVETDVFCDCGYNLHAQPVWRDERLELLVCRCPECGRHAAAGRFTGVHSAWLHRLSTTLVVVWVGFLLLTFLFLIGWTGAWPGMHIERFVTYNPVTTVAGAVPTEYVLDFRQIESYEQRDVQHFVGLAVLMAAINGLALGVAAAVFLWHLRRRVYLLALAPVPIALIVYFLWQDSRMTPAVGTWMVQRLLAYTALQSACVLAGIAIGRPVTRFVLQLLLPARLLQHLAFFWYRDRLPLNLAGATQKEGGAT
jgi:hypothetical protein